MNVRALQKPLKERYRSDPASSRITLAARGGQTGAPIACSVDIGRAGRRPAARRARGLAPRSPARWWRPRWVSANSIEVTAEGDLELAGTLGVSREAPVGFERIRLRFDVEAPEATPDQLRARKEKTEQYCVVMQTLTKPPAIETVWT
jgi:hypothetical protein